MERNHQELMPNRSVQFVCDYRQKQANAEMFDNQNLQLPEPEQLTEQESYTEHIETIHVTLDDAALLKSEMLCTEPSQAEIPAIEPLDMQEPEMQESIQQAEERIEEVQEETEGFPLWKRNNYPSRLFYPESPGLTGKTQPQYQDAAIKLSPIKPFRLFCGMIVLMTAFAGVVCFCMFGSTPSVQDSAQLSTFLTPVMMQNPEPFSSVSQANNDMILQASVWRVVTLNSNVYKEIDDKGRLMVPGADVEKACTELFGSACRLAAKQPTEETFFTYDNDSDTYRVLPQSSLSAQAVKIKNIQKESGAVIVTVETVAANEKISTLYRYVLEFDGFSGEPYLTSVERI